MDSWWLDATEPAYKDGLYPEKQTQWSKKAGKTFIGSAARYLNTYSYVLTKMMYENLRKQSDNRASVLTRSAFAGQQRFWHFYMVGRYLCFLGCIKKATL